MIRRPPNACAAFTLPELMVSLVLLGLMVSLGAIGWQHIMIGQTRNNAQCELDMDVRTAIEHLRADIRLTDLNRIQFYPTGAGPYTALSFPRGADTNGDGMLEMDAGGTNILWLKTVVYHVFQTTPNQLRRTTFINRNQSATDSNRLWQLAQVVATGGGSSACLAGETAQTEVLFANLFTWSLTARTASYDGYSSTLMRNRMFFGSIALTSGTHTVEFTVIDRNPASSGCKLGIDVLNASASGSDQEAEEAASTAIGGGPAPVKTYTPNGSWSANYQLVASCTATGQGASVTVRNDQWCEQNFNSFGANLTRTVASFDTTLPPNGEFALKLAGDQGPSWTPPCDSYGWWNWFGYSVSVPIRILVRGDDVKTNGFGPIIYFYKYQNAMTLRNLTIGLAVSNTCDAIPGTMVPLTLYQNGVAKSRWEDCSDCWGAAGQYPVIAIPSNCMAFTPQQTYVVSAYMALTNAIVYGYYDNHRVMSYLLNAGTPADTAADTWSTNANLSTSSYTYGIHHIETAYAPQGTYDSRIFDTGQDVDTAKSIYWAADTSNNTACTIMARTGDQPDLSDATALTNLTALSGQGTFSGNMGRYIQFRATLKSNPTAQYPNVYTPRLKYVRFEWPGDSKMIDIAGLVSTGPDYGVCAVTVDGKPLTKAVKVDLNIYSDVRRLSGTSERLISQMSAEMAPRNTNK